LEAKPQPTKRAVDRTVNGRRAYPLVADAEKIK
jgi:hypothetical protein